MNKILTWRDHSWRDHLWRCHSYISLGFRIYLSYVFIAACIHKIADPASFAVDIATYDIMPLWSINIMAITLPWTELIVGILLIIGYKTRAAALIICGMMTMFIIALLIALYTELNISCGCFASQGVSHDPISYLTVLRDLAWLLMAGYIYIFGEKSFGLDNLRERKANK